MTDVVGVFDCKMLYIISRTIYIYFFCPQYAVAGVASGSYGQLFQGIVVELYIWKIINKDLFKFFSRIIIEINNS